MSTSSIKKPQPPEAAEASAKQPPSGEAAQLPAETEQRIPDTGEPGGGQGRTDVVGVLRNPVPVDPDITEGHEGYEESGDSEVVPVEHIIEDITRDLEEKSPKAK
jgi:hypothetical protein